MLGIEGVRCMLVREMGEGGETRKEWAAEGCCRIGLRGGVGLYEGSSMSEETTK